MLFCKCCKIFKNILWQNISEWLLLKFRSSRQVFCKKDVLKNFAKFTGKQLCRVSFWIKLQTWGLHFIKKRLLAQVFYEVLKKTFFIEHLWWVILYVYQGILRKKFSEHFFYTAHLRNCLFHVQVAEVQPADTLFFKHFMQEQEVAIQGRHLLKILKNICEEVNS